MDVVSMLNMVGARAAAAAAAAVAAEGAGRGDGGAGLEREAHERRDSGDDNSSGMESLMRTPSTTTNAGNSAPTSTVATPPSERTLSRRSSESKTPNRNRTPWDANGYSLPLSLDTKDMARNFPATTIKPSSNSTSGTAVPSGDTPSSAPEATCAAAILSVGTAAAAAAMGGNSSPKGCSPKHKFSDSRSSLSSFHTSFSSTNSVSHSRISSLSTVSENQPLSALITDFSMLDTGISSELLNNSSNSSNSHLSPVKAPQHQKPQQLQNHGISTDSADHNPQLEPPTPVRSRHDEPVASSLEPSPRSSAERAQSPSDAMLIPRFSKAADGAAPTSDVDADREHSLGSLGLQIPSAVLRHQLQPQQESSPTRRHKRAVSAPDFPSLTASSFNPRFPTFGPIPEPTPSPSQHSDGIAMEHSMAQNALRPSPDELIGSSGSSFVGQAASSRMTADGSGDSGSSGMGGELPVNLEMASACMYRGDCQTGSQLRKAISHIFGRNKLCTRMIPTGVWVHYCRKHYQRTRYRNGGEYPQRQIGLVQVQVRRVQAWSENNTRLGHGPILKDWSLSVRKREQMRLDSKLATTGKKRPFHDDGDEDEEDGFDDERTEMSGTAVPDWVVARIGDGYSTAEILVIVDRLKADIDQGRLQQIPDIEILPNIVTESLSDDAGGGGSNGSSTGSVKKNYVKRRTMSAARNGGGGGSGGGGGLDSGGMTQGRQGSNGHRRSQSVNTSSLRRDFANSAARRSSQPSNFGSANIPQSLHFNDLQAPLEKRQRVDGEGGVGPSGHAHKFGMGPSPGLYDAPAANGGMLPRGMLVGGGSRQQLAHRPAFAGIRESQAESPVYASEQQWRQRTETMGGTSDHHHYLEHARSWEDGTYSQAQQEYDAQQLRSYDYHHHKPSGSAGGSGGSSGSGASGASCGSTIGGVLPAPNPLRFGGVGVSVVQQLESSSYLLNSAATRRGNAHQRSQSEAGGFLHHMMSSQRGRSTSSAGGLPPLQTFGLSATSSSSFNAANGANGASGVYQSQLQGSHGSRVDHRRSSLTGSAYSGGSGGGNGYSSAANYDDDKFDNVQLPPLQAIPALQTPQEPAALQQQQLPPHRPRQFDQVAHSGGSMALVDRQLAAVSEYHQAAFRHSRHQSSPAVPRIRPPSLNLNMAVPATAPVDST